MSVDELHAGTDLFLDGAPFRLLYLMADGHDCQEWLAHPLFVRGADRLISVRKGQFYRGIHGSTAFSAPCRARAMHGACSRLERSGARC
jgi:hypothetical protein